VEAEDVAVGGARGAREEAARADCDGAPDKIVVETLKSGVVPVVARGPVGIEEAPARVDGVEAEAVGAVEGAGTAGTDKDAPRAEAESAAVGRTAATRRACSPAQLSLRPIADLQLQLSDALGTLASGIGVGRRLLESARSARVPRQSAGRCC